MTTYRSTLEQFLVFICKREGRPARVADLTPEAVQAWMDDMATADLALSTMRSRQSMLSSLCAWLVKRECLAESPVAKLDRRRYERMPPAQVPGTALMAPLFMAFDCLRLRGRDVRPLPLRDRRKTLEVVVDGAELGYSAPPRLEYGYLAT